MTKFGQVKEYDAATQMATIVYTRPDACEKCGACGTKPHQGTIRLKAACATGDWVRVEMPDALFLRSAALGYLLPLCCFLLGLGAGYLLGGGRDAGAVAGGLAGLALGLLATWTADRLVRHKPEWSPRVTAVYASKPDMDDIGCGGAGR